MSIHITIDDDLEDGVKGPKVRGEIPSDAPCDDVMSMFFGLLAAYGYSYDTVKDIVMEMADAWEKRIA